MSFALCVLEQNGQPVPAIKIGEEFYALNDVAPGLIANPAEGLLDLLPDWDNSFAKLEQAVAAFDGAAKPTLVPGADGVRYNLLVTNPKKIVCAGMNYYCHLRKDAKREIKKEDYDCLFFLKGSDQQLAADRTIPFPSHTVKYDWEVEIVIVIGKEGRNIKAADAAQHIAGYAVGNDLSARDWQFNPRHIRQFDLVAGKAFDNAAPVGPWMVPAKFVDIENMWLKLWVNDDLKQDSTTKEMIWTVGELIESYSSHSTLRPGDLLFTGAPAGVGMATDTYLKPGDVMVAEVEGLGRLETRLRAD